MTPKYVKFNGVQSNASGLGLVVQTPPTYQYPARSVEKTQIPGRNGSLVIDNNNYANVTRQYSFARILEGSENYVDMSADILAWLQSGEGRYCRLEDQYDPDVYRMAMYDEANSFVNVFDGAVTVTANFECKPQRFLKSGEQYYYYNNTSYPISYDDVEHSLTIINTTKYTAIPYIFIRAAWLNGFTPIEGSIINGSVLIENKSVNQPVWSTVCYINFNNIPVPSSWSLGLLDSIGIVIESEEKQCFWLVHYSLGNTEEKIDISDYVNLNGYDFPVLKPGQTRFKFNTPVEHKYTVASYNTLIAGNQLHCTSVYQPKEKIEELRQHKVSLPSYDAIIDKFEYVNSASSFYQHLIDLSEKNLTEVNPTTAAITRYNSGYVNLTSPTTLLEQTRIAYMYEHPVLDDSIPSGMYISVTESNNTVTITVADGGGGYFFSTSKDNTIKTYAQGATIWSGSIDNTITIYQYVTNINVLSVSSLPVPHQDLPKWLSEYYTYDTIDGAKVLTGYVVKPDTSHLGYYYQEKTSLVGSSKWVYKNSTDKVLELKWKKSNKGFMPVSGVNLTVKTEFPIRYVRNDATVYGYTFEDSKNLFTVATPASNAAPDTISIYAAYTGWYKVTIDGNSLGGWHLISSGNRLVSSLASNKTFKVEALIPRDKFSGNYPTYKDFFSDSDEDEWTKNFDSILEDVNPVGGIPFAGSSTPQVQIKFKATATELNYRYMKADENISSYTSWVPTLGGATITLNETGQLVTSSDAVTFATIATSPTAWIDDRAFKYIAAGQTTEDYYQDPPDWLDYQIVEETDNGETKKVIKYYSKVASSPADLKYKYKWGTAIAWQNRSYVATEHATESLLTTDDNTNDLELYCLKSTPQYSNSYIESESGAPSLIYVSAQDPGFVNLIVNEDSDGNFTDVQYVVNAGGNNKKYRINYQTYWKVYNTGDELHDATIDESVIVKVIASETNILSTTGGSSTDVQPDDLRIKPNWWKL